MLTAASILDDFSKQAYTPEFRLIDLLPTTYEKQLASNNIDFLFIESAWRPYNSAWRLAIDKPIYRKESLLHIERITEICKQRGIPTLFWVKEDPPHFNRFFPYTKYFDYVATTDLNCVPKYKEKLGNKNVFCLRFAAQPDICKYRGITNRVSRACFAGAYRKNYKHRVAGMRHVVFPAADVGLDIFDRTLSDGRGHSFPKKIRKHVVEGLPYSHILKKYTEYKAFLNVDSVNSSPSMLSRRVFELLCCGTPVVSYPSLAIKKMKIPVVLSNNADTTRDTLTKLFKDTAFWDSASKDGLKFVISNHTYAHRAAKICNKLKLDNTYATSRINHFKEMYLS